MYKLTVSSSDGSTPDTMGESSETGCKDSVGRANLTGEPADSTEDVRTILAANAFSSGVVGAQRASVAIGALRTGDASNVVSNWRLGVDFAGLMLSCQADVS